VACVLRRGDHVPFDAFIPTIRLVAPCRAIPLPAWFVSGFGERASVPRLGFGLGRIWVSRVSLPLSFYYSCVYLQYIVIVIVIYKCKCMQDEALSMLENSPFQVTGYSGYCMRVRKFRGVRKEMAMKWQTDAEGLPFHFTESRVLESQTTSMQIRTSFPLRHPFSCNIL